MFSLKGKSAIITGGGSGIGKAISVLFAEQGAHVHIIELNADAGVQTANEIKEAGGIADVHGCDVSNQEAVVTIFKQIGKIKVILGHL